LKAANTGKRRPSPTAENAVAHGLTSRRVLADERALYTQWLQRLTVELQPETNVEHMLVTRIAFIAVKMARIIRTDLDLFSLCWSGENGTVPKGEQGHAEGEGDAGPTLDPGALSDTVPLLSRYDTSTYNAFVKALHELERQKDRRSGTKTLSVRVVDVNY
jgi:hypothetical protein